VQLFDITITTTNGDVLHQQVCEALAVRVAELNRWRTGGGLAFPFLRLAVVGGNSRLSLARASYQALLGTGGIRDRTHETGAATYHDVVRVVCRPIPNRTYQPAIAVQADGEVLGASCAAIEMAGLEVCLLSANQ
jgi:diacylglycerol kinase (ATP)